MYAVFFPWTLNDIANSLGKHTERWHIVVEKFAAIGSESGSSHAKNTSNLFQLIRRTNPSWESLSRLLSRHPRMRDSIRAVIGRNEGPAAIADTSVFNRPNQTRVKEHLPWNRVAVDTAVTEGAPTPHLHHLNHHLLLSLRYQSPAIVQSLPETCLRS